MDHEHTDAASSRRQTRRAWRRNEAPAGGWWPWGWIPLIGLLLTFVYGLFITVPDTQAQTRDSVSRALTASDYRNLEVIADGQQVIVRGEGDAVDEPRIASIARGSACNTFLARDLVCPTDVNIQLTAPVVAAKAVAAPAPQSANPSRHRHAFSIQKLGTGLLLEGEVPDEARRQRIVDLARDSFEQVTDKLTVTDSAATPDYDWATGKAWGVLQSLETGGVAWRDGVLSAWGQVLADNETAIHQAFTSQADRARLGKLDLTVVSQAHECNARFAAALDSATIRFQSGSAAIAADSAPLLQRLAALADECQIALDVEGHTDNVGSIATNERLSLARAEAVAAALQGLGVDSARLTPRGYGPAKPVADNSTQDGRARNRRIEIRASDETQPTSLPATNTL